MFKRIIALACALAIGLGFMASAVNSEKITAMSAIGVVNGNTSSSVTRAEFAEMLVNTSSFSGIIGEGYGYSLYKDVKSTHESSAYIKVAVEEGWMTGYVDGTFRPDNTMKFEEVVSSVLKLLDYDTSALAGSYPMAQLSKASSIGLLNGINATQGQTVSVGTAAEILYNALTCVTGSGSNTVYGASIGLSVSGDTVDYSSIIQKDTEGPYVANGNVAIPFDLSTATVYRDGAETTDKTIRSYEVYYYHEAMNTVWIYTDKAFGTINAIAPSDVSPTSVTVSGVSYDIGTTNATYQLSNGGTYKVGDSVTLLLGMNGEVVEVVSGANLTGNYYGMVESSEPATSTDGSQVLTSTKVMCTDGVTRTFLHDGATQTKGNVVEVIVSEDGAEMTKITNAVSIPGKATLEGIGGYQYADNVEMIDVDGYSNAVSVYPTRLAGYTIDNSQVKLTVLNDDKEITHVILENATGDAMSLAYFTKVEEKEGSSSETYTGYVDGVYKSLTTETKQDANGGGNVVYYDSDGSVAKIESLSSVKLSDIYSFTAETSKGVEMDIAENAQVYIKDGNDFVLTTVQAIQNENYALTGWYDDLDFSAGGQIRIIIAS